MSATTGIEWTDATWNPTRGCRRVSPGCEHCYAETMAVRFDKPGLWGDGLTSNGRWNGRVVTVPAKLGDPLRWRKPRRIFVNSTSDLFHEDVPNEYIAAVFGVMAACPQHTFQILTKRAERMDVWWEWYDAQPCTGAGRAIECAGKHVRWSKLLPGFVPESRPWPLPNVWLGVSAEDQQRADERIPHLLNCPAAVHWVSYEPALSAVDFTRWFDHNPVHEADRDGGSSLRSGAGGLDRSASGRLGLADRATPQESMERRRHSAPDQAASDRCCGRGGLSIGPHHGEREAVGNTGASACVASAAGADPGRSDCEPQERQEARQSAGQPRVGDILGADDARLSNGVEGRARGAESGREVVGPDGDRHPRGVRGGRGDTDGAGSPSRREVSAGVEDRAGRAAPEAGRPHGGLHSATSFWDAGAGRIRTLRFIVIGGESGASARPCDIEWIREGVRQCREAGVAAFVKQLGARPVLTRSPSGAPDDGGDMAPLVLSDPKGGNPTEWPEDLRVREFPGREALGDGGA